MSMILVSLFYLANKNKLGPIGNIVTNHIKRFSRGKFGNGIIFTLVFTAYFFGNAIYGIENAPVQVKQAFQEELASEGVTDYESFKNKMPEAELSWILLIVGIIVLILPTAAGHAAYATINELTNGWALHFVTVLFLEQIEILGLLVYFRYVRKGSTVTT